MVVTNIITEVIKKLTWDKIPTNILVVCISELLTLAVGAAYTEINSIVIVWYHVVGAVIVGIFVAYAAMFGFDKLRQAVEQITSIKTGTK
jgi:ABC-type glycerol-3-phosphate transport system permease component